MQRIETDGKVIELIRDALYGADVTFIEHIANEVLPDKVVYIGDGFFRIEPPEDNDD